MANVTSNSLFIASALALIVGLLFLAYPVLTSAVVILCVVGHAYYNHSWAISRIFSHLISVLRPLECGSDQQTSYPSTLLGSADLPSPIPHVSSGLETIKNRRNPAVDVIVSSTPRSTPTSSHGSGGSSSFSHPIRSSSNAVAPDSHQLNFGRIGTPKSSRAPSQDVQQNSTESHPNHKQSNRNVSGKTVQTTAGPLLPCGRYNPTFDAGIFVNVNSPGFTDRLVRCASDTGINWNQTNLATQQDRYNSVGLFPIVHLNAHSPPSLSPQSKLKAAHSNVRIRIAPPAYSDQRQLYNRGFGIPMQSYAPTREVMRRNEVAKSVLESLQEASRKRIFSQCQEALEDDTGKKRHKKSDSALPNPNCDTYQYRHVQAPLVPSTLSMGRQNDTNSQSKRTHNDSSPKANVAKRPCQHVKMLPVNNEITSSLSSSKTLLQRMSGSKRKADDEHFEEVNGKHFKDSFTAARSSKWLPTRPCDEGESSARTQEIVRTQNNSSDNTAVSAKIVQRKLVTTDNRETCDSVKKSMSSSDSMKCSREKTPDKPDPDLALKLFRKDVVSRPHSKPNSSRQKGSSWTQVPPDADERCHVELNGPSELDRPERFQSLLSRMCCPDVIGVKDSVLTAVSSEISKNTDTVVSIGVGNVDTEVPSVPTVLSTNLVVSSLVSSSNSTLTSTSPTFSASETALKPQTSAFVSPLSPSSTSPTESPPACVTQSTGFSLSPVGKDSSQERDNQTDKQPSCVFPASSASSAFSPAKSMFSFSSPSSTTVSQSVSNQAVLSVSTITSSISNPVSSTPANFKLSMSPVKLCAQFSDESKLTIVPNSTWTVLSNPKTVFTQSSGVSSPSEQNQSTIQPNMSSSEKAATSTTDFSTKFTSPSQSPQFMAGSASAMLSRSEPQTSGLIIDKAATNCLAPTASTQPQVPDGSKNSLGQKSSIGGFNFSGSRGPLLGQPAAIGVATAPSFSFSSVTTTTSSLPCSISDSKSTCGSGSIIFGTVSTPSLESSNPLTFNFSTSTLGKAAANENSEVSCQFGTSASSGFSNPSQVVFNGFSSVANSTKSSTTAFETAVRQSQGSGGFSFGNTSHQSPSSVTFGAPATTSASIFGDKGSQQSSFGATTTAGFPMESAVSSFSSSPFGPLTSNALPFVSTKPTTSSFGGLASTGITMGLIPSSTNPSPFGSSSTPPMAPTFGTTPQLSFGMLPPSDAPYGTSPAIATTTNNNNTFTFGADRPAAAAAFNFGANSASSGSSFSFGSPQQQPSNSVPFHFGQAPNLNAAPTFHFGPSSSQPSVFSFGTPTSSFGSATNPATVGNFTIGGFSMGSGPAAPQRTRALPTRRRRI